jgi:protease II
MNLPSLEISTQTSMTRDDIISTVQSNKMFSFDLETDKCTIISDTEAIESYVKEQEKKVQLCIEQKKLIWAPFVLSRHSLILK